MSDVKISQPSDSILQGKGDFRSETVRNRDTKRLIGAGMTSDGKFHMRTRPATFNMRIGSTSNPVVDTLLDTCSGMSIMSTDVFYSQFEGDPGTNVKLKVHGVGKQQSIGYITTTCFIETNEGSMVEFDVEFHLMENFGLGACVGIDVMSSYGINFITTEKKAVIASINETFPLEYMRPPHQDRIITVKAKERTRVKRECHRMTELDVDLPWGRDYLFEPVLLSRPGHGFMMCPNQIISAETKFLPLGNFSSVTESVSRGQILGYARPISKDADVSVVGYTSEITDPAGDDSDIKADEYQKPKIFHEPELLDKSEHISESCLVGNVEPADMIDPSDRDPAPHQQAPTYKQFDIARNSDGVPHPELIKVIEDNLEAFTFDGSPGIIKDGSKISIETGDHPLHSEPLRPLGPEKRQVESETVKRLLKWNVIQKSNSPVNYAVCLVKQGGKWRFCIDYRKLNEVTRRDSYPMQRQDVIFNNLGGFQFFLSLDAAKGYHQMDVDEKDRWKTAFVTHEGLYEYRKMPFGLKCAPAVFQRFMDRLLGCMRWQSALVYIDDVIIYSMNISEHAAHIDTLLKAAIKVGLKFEPEKCHFGYSKLKLLGRVISREGLSINECRAKSLLELDSPRNAEELYHIIGLFGYYRMFVYKYSILMEPITKLTAGIKMSKKDKGWKKLPVKWGPEQQEAFEKMKKILSNPPVLAYPDWKLPFILYTDACKEGFAFAIHQKFPVTQSEGQTMLMTEDLNIRWKKELTKDVLWAKILHKLKNTSEKDDAYGMVDGMLLVKHLDGRKLCVPKGILKEVFNDHHDTLGHPGFHRSWNLLKKQCWRPNLATMLKTYIDECPVCQRSKPGPQKEGDMAIREIIPVAFHSVAMDFVTGLPVSGSGKFDAVLTIVDLFTKCVILAPTYSQYTAESTAQIFIDHVIRRGFLPKEICSDNDKTFIGKFWDSVMKKMSIKLLFTSPYHPQADPAERYNQVMESLLRCMCWDNPSDWSEKLVWVELAMNSLQSESTKSTPFELLYVNASGPFTQVREILEAQGRTVDRAEDFISIAVQRLNDAKFYIDQSLRTSKKLYDARHTTPTVWHVGDRALILLERRPIQSIMRTKLSNKTLGPFKVLEVYKRSLVLQIPSHLKMMPRVSTQHVKKWRDDSGFGRKPNPDPIETVDNEEMFEIDRIVAKRSFGKNRLVQYKIRWKNFSDQDDTWEFEDDLKSDGCQDVIDNYESSSANCNVALNTKSFVEKPIVFESRVTRSYEKNYESLELELAALTWAILKSERYLDGSEFTVVNDHLNFRTILDTSTPALYSRQVNKFRMLLQPFRSQMKIVHKAGSTHRNVDALSRLRKISSSEDDSSETMNAS